MKRENKCRKIAPGLFSPAICGPDHIRSKGERPTLAAVSAIGQRRRRRRASRTVGRQVPDRREPARVLFGSPNDSLKRPEHRRLPVMVAFMLALLSCRATSLQPSAAADVLTREFLSAASPSSPALTEFVAPGLPPGFHALDSRSQPVDSSNEPLSLPAEWPMYLLAAEPCPQTDAPYTLVVSPQLRKSLTQFCNSLDGKLSLHRSLESCNPIPPYDPEVLSASLRCRFAMGQPLQTIRCNRLQRPDVVFLEGEEDPSGTKDATMRTIKAVIVIEPTGTKKPEDAKSLERRAAHVFSSDGESFETPYFGLSLLGDAEFIDRCLAYEYLGRLFVADGPSHYLRLLASGNRADIDSFHDGLTSDIEDITTTAQSKVLDRQVLRSSLMKIVPKEVADRSASRLSAGTGAGILQPAMNIAAGSKDPLSDLAIAKRRLDAALKSFGPQGLLWFVRDHLSQCAVTAADSEGMWIMQASEAVWIADSIGAVFPLRGDKGKIADEQELETLKADISAQEPIAMKDQSLKLVNDAISQELTGWENAAVAARMLPAVPSRPAPPRKKRSNIPLDEKVAALARQSAAALGRGDTDRFFELKVAETNAAVAAIEATRVVDDESDPDYRAALRVYEQEIREWEKYRDALKVGVQEAHDKKWRWCVNALQQVHEDEKAMKNVKPLAAKEGTAFLVPSFRMWLLRQQDP